MTTNKSLKSGLKKSTYIIPAVLTMAILPNIVVSGNAHAASKCSSKSGCQPEFEAVSVAAPGALGILGLGIAGIAATRLIRKNKSINKE